MSELIDRYERVTDAMAQRLVEAWDAMATQIGDRPFWNEQQPERDQAKQYQLVRNDPQAWAALMQEHGYVRTVEYMLRGERLSAKYPDEAAYGQEALRGEALMAPPPGATATAAAPVPSAPPTTPTLSEERHVPTQQREINLSEGQIGR